MEYCGGGDLSNFIRSRKTLTEVEVKYFLQQLGTTYAFIFSAFSFGRDVCLLGSFNLWVIQVVISTKAVVMDKAKYDHQLYLGLL